MSRPTGTEQRLYYSDIDTHGATEVDGLDDALRLAHGRWGAGRDWWLIAAWTAEDAIAIADALSCKDHPRQVELWELHEAINLGFTPSLEPLYADKTSPPDLLPRDCERPLFPEQNQESGNGH
jgi:hypothetical protein